MADDNTVAAAAARAVAEPPPGAPRAVALPPYTPPTGKPAGEFIATKWYSMPVFDYATRGDMVLTIVGLILMAASGCGLPLFSLVFGDLIDSLGAPSPDDHPIGYYALILVYLGAGVGTVCFLGGWCIELAAEREIRRIRYEYFRAVVRQEMRWFDQTDPGTLASKLNQNCVSIRDGMSLKMGQLAMMGATFVAGYVVGFIRNWKMTLVLTAVVPIMVASGYLMMLSMNRAQKRSKNAYSDAGSVVEEVLSSIRTVVSFGAEEKSLQRYQAHLGIAEREGRKGGLITALCLGVTFLAVFWSYALGFWYGGKLVSDDMDAGCVENCLTGGKVLAVFFSIVFGAFSLGQAGPPLTAFLAARASALDLREVMHRKSSIDPEDEGGVKDKHIEGEIEFRNVAFAYPSRADKQVFQKMSLKIPAGKTVALVGASGCGKSTTVQLLQRFYDPDGGELLIDGVPLQQYNIKWIRDQMSLVSQEPRLFARSIAENIRDGKLTASLGEVEQAARNANAMGFISEFPDGLDTFVGESGSQLSGGQKQRIAIARAMLRDPPILILDEATSALDNQSEKVVQDTIDKLISAKKRTTIIIAHKLTTIRQADLIVVFHNPTGDGAVVAEQGTHDELMQIDNGLYKALVETQIVASRLSHSASLTISRRSSEASVMTDPDVEKRLSGLLRDSSGALRPRKSASTMQVLAEVITETPKKDKELEKVKVSYWRVLKLLKPKWKEMVIGIIGELAAGVVFPIYALIFAQFIGVYFQTSSDDIRSDSSKYALYFVALGAGSLLAELCGMYFTEASGQYVARSMREVAFEAMIYQDVGFFDEKSHSTGVLSEILSADAMLIKGWSGTNVGLLFKNGSTLLAAIIIAFTANAKLAAVSLAAFMALVPAIAIETKMMQGEGGDDDKAAGFIVSETISNIRTVTSYNLQSRLLEDYDAVLKIDQNRNQKKLAVGTFFFGLSQTIQFCANALMMWYGGKLLGNGEIKSISDMLRASTSIIMAGMGIGQNIIFTTDSAKARSAAERIYAIVDRESPIDARSNEGVHLSAGKVHGALELRNVNFRYPTRPEVAIFKSVSLNVQPGETAALVGASGCGKSTIIQLLERFYDVVGGRDKSKGGGCLMLDDTDVRDANVKSLRKVLGLVGQEPVLFDTTISENIKYGNTEATQAEVENACKMSNAHNFIMEFPEGYETRVGKRGGQLSGGQKQRIAIARAIIRNPKILLLDEATSALDSQSERIVQDALDNLMSSSKRTTIVIAHRLATVRNADKIIVLANPDGNGSEVVEIGTHDQLMNKEDGIYRGLVNIAAREGDVEITK